MAPLIWLGLGVLGYLAVRSSSSSGSSGSAPSPSPTPNTPAPEGILPGSTGDGKTVFSATENKSGSGTTSGGSSTTADGRTWSWDDYNKGKTQNEREGGANTGKSSTDEEDDYVSEVIGKTSDTDTSQAEAMYAQGYRDGYADFPNYDRFNAFNESVYSLPVPYEQGYDLGRAQAESERDVVGDSLEE